ncbi:MAG: GNAT family N-acetyltransferase [Chloroflexota bacterium]
MGRIAVSEYAAENRAEWEAFVDNSNNGGMFHKQAFLDYHAPGRFDFTHLLFRDEYGKLIAVLPGGFKEGGRVYWSPVGASYGSLVSGDIAFGDALEVVDAMLEYFRSRGTEEIFLIPPPLIYSKVYNQHLEYAMLYRKFDFENHYISHAVDLTPGVNTYMTFDLKAQKTISKIRREGVIVVKESDNFEEYYPILEENKLKHGVKPTHSLEDLNRLKTLTPNNIKLLTVYKDEEPVAGSMLFLVNDKVSLCFYVMMKYEHRALRPVFLALDESIRWSAAKGYEWFDIGVSQDTAAEDPMTPALSLIYFKERFNARGIFRSTYHLKLK